jgi:hypothetical protein
VDSQSPLPVAVMSDAQTAQAKEKTEAAMRDLEIHSIFMLTAVHRNLDTWDVELGNRLF